MTEIARTFDYSRIDSGVAQFVRNRKQEMINRSVVSVIAEGRDLLAIRHALGSDAELRD